MSILLRAVLRSILLTLLSFSSYAANPVTVAVLDSGYHPQSTIKQPVEAASFDGSSLIPGIQDPDCDPHGSYVANVLTHGAALQPYLDNVRVLHGRVIGCHGFTSDSLVRGIAWASSRGAAVINVSLSSDPGVACPADLQSAISEAKRNGANIVVAAGNNGSADLPFPANCKDVVLVTAHNSGLTVANWANYSPNAISAPGENLAIPTPSGTFNGFGTSFAAPSVSAALALLSHLIPGSTPAQREYFLQSYAVPSSNPAKSYGSLSIVDAPKIAATLRFNLNPNVTVDRNPVELGGTVCLSNASTINGNPVKVQFDANYMASQGYTPSSGQWCKKLNTPGTITLPSTLIYQGDADTLSIPMTTPVTVSSSARPTLGALSPALKQLFCFGPNANAAEIREGTSQSFDLSALNPNNATLKVTWLTSNGWTSSLHNNSLTITAPANSAGSLGSFSIQIEAADGLTSEAITLSVVSLMTNHVNDPATSNSGGGGGDASILLLVLLAGLVAGIRRTTH